jgi:hypothetical protein
MDKKGTIGDRKSPPTPMTTASTDALTKHRNKQYMQIADAL